ncbi:hypothetical protein [Pseudoalteromonas rubra]|uniref:hypothetical protein n=1 Tax=Pseudoalteromonas rubra TaxID=43658 RepID=UPI000F798086|nr:hypothetical protein [Pseudoalteromonas rubra]
MDLYSLIPYLPLPLILSALAITWRYETSRYFLLLLLIVELVDEALNQVSVGWSTHLYLYCMIMNLAFIVPVVFRVPIAHWLYSVTKISFFERVAENTRFALQEIGLLTIFAASFLLNLVVYVEVWLYKLYVIDSLLILDNVRSGTQSTLHVLMCFGLMTYVAKTPARERFYNG